MAKIWTKMAKKWKIRPKTAFWGMLKAKFGNSESVSQFFCQFYIGNDISFSLFVVNTSNELLKHFRTKISNIWLFGKFCYFKVKWAYFDFLHQYLLQSLQYRYHLEHKAPIYHVIIITGPKTDRWGWKIILFKILKIIFIK